jgi:dienelactone hydrolase
VRVRRTLTIGLPILVLLTGYAAHDYVRGAVFLVRAAGIEGVAGTAARWDAEDVSEQWQPIPWRGGSLPGRLFRPSSGGGRPILLVPGVHAAGVDEPRLMKLARDLAATGYPVLTAGLPDLAAYSVTPRSTDMIEDAALWLSRQPGVAVDDGRIGMMGISFAGGLSIVAAGRPSLADRVAYVMSLGGHGDLPRTLRYLCTGIQPDGVTRPAHDYGLAIILLGVADQVVPVAQADPLRQVILSFLEASRLDMVDVTRAKAEFARASSLAAALPEPAKTMMSYVNTRDVARLGPILLPHTAALGGDPSLSVSRSPAPRCPVYLLHGSDDNVVPTVESILMARDLRQRGVEVHVVTTPLITHARVDRSASARAMWDVIMFWGDLLDE